MYKKVIALMPILFAFAICSFASTNVTVQPPAKQSIFDLVNYQEIQEVSLELDLQDLLSNRRSEESFKGTFTFKDQNGIDQVFKTKVNIRGKFRRTRCTAMPPLKLNFKKNELSEKGLTLHDDFKLVTQCVEDEDKAKELLLKEYLAYKMYNQLSDYSFRVQFLKINFIDKVTGEENQQYGFIIEDNAQLRERLSLEKHGSKFGIPKDKLEKETEKTVALFEYMIGNLDWEIYKKVHNVKLFERGEELIPVPYDFDFSGIVNAPYALLNSNFDVVTLQDRYYLGNPDNLIELDATKKLFKDKKEAMIKVVKDCKTLKKSSRKEMINYINSFYSTIDTIVLPKEKCTTKISDKS